MFHGLFSADQRTSYGCPNLRIPVVASSSDLLVLPGGHLGHFINIFGWQAKGLRLPWCAAIHEILSHLAGFSLDFHCLSPPFLSVDHALTGLSHAIEITHSFLGLLFPLYT
jgi:hypothetical protein